MQIKLLKKEDKVMVNINKNKLYTLDEIVRITSLDYEILKDDIMNGKLIAKKDYKTQRVIYKNQIITGKNLLRYLTIWRFNLLKQLNLEAVTDEDCKEEDYLMLEEELKYLKYQQQEYSKLIKVIDARITTVEKKLDHLK